MESGLERLEVLASLTVIYVCISLHKSSKEIRVKFRLSDTVASFLTHLSASFNGVQNCSKGKELHLLAPKGSKRLDQRRLVSLESLGVRNNDCLELRGYRPISKKQYEYPLEVIVSDDEKVEVEVTNTTDMIALKHKLQNETGVHWSEIMLYCNGKSLPKHSLRTVEFYGGRSSSKVLKMQQAVMVKSTEVVMHAPEASDLRPSSSLRSAAMDFKDGPYHGQDQSRSRRVLRYTAPTCYPDDYLSRVPLNPISEIGFVEISKEEFEWKQLAIRLGITNGERQHIEHDYRTLEDIKLHMFLRWKRKNGGDATWKKLQEAVLDEGNKQLAEKIIELARKRKNSDGTPPDSAALLSDEKPVHTAALLSDEKPATKRPHLSTQQSSCTEQHPVYTHRVLS